MRSRIRQRSEWGAGLAVAPIAAPVKGARRTGQGRVRGERSERSLDAPEHSRMIAFGAAASPHGWRSVSPRTAANHATGIRVSRGRALRESLRAKAHTPDTMNATPSARAIWPTLHGCLRLTFPVDNDADNRGVSDPPGRPRGRWPGQRGGSLTPRSSSSFLVGGGWRGIERRSTVGWNAGCKRLTGWD